MSDLISRTELLDTIRQKMFDTRYDIELAMDVIKTTPAVDAVPVVRCGECEHYMCDVDSYFQCDFGGGLNHPESLDYCSYGERTEGGDKG